ncbi:InlB B-repeat-containing protein [Candidatus Magnetobacterium casense]|uniref:VCBS repeat-containing protein n=1 Tax=Candidatus Magnetobacterium casense TaxID=1455061 RepID=A0ABS6RZG9_9BACT|nr:FG-GAP-like repeat-containing protein [Candidatus Magnetobacterium casensis]MBV6342050.1 VCBS repeat-containing protein [Candidatus Magnetobacterium casensis]
MNKKNWLMTTVTAILLLVVFSPVMASAETLTITKTGNGAVTGVIATTPITITWTGGNGTSTLATGSVVTLSALPDTDYYFGGWGGDCHGTGECRLTMTANKTVTATFIANQFVTRLLTVTKKGVDENGVANDAYAKGSIEGTYETPTAGGAIVFYWGAGAGNVGTAVFDNTGAIATIVATPNTGYLFDGWSGECSGTGNCILQMTGDRSVEATFKKATNVKTILTVTKSGKGIVTGTYVKPTQTGTASGSVIFSWSGDIGTATFDDPNTIVTLLANPNTGNTFDGWGGDDCSGTGSCVVQMTAAKTVSATFNKLPEVSKILTLTKVGNGSVTGSYVKPIATGTESGSVLFAWSGDVGTMGFDSSGAVVTLTAAADTGYTFTGWSGSCTGTGTCVVTMTESKDVTATFTSSNPMKLTVFKTGSGTGTVTAVKIASGTVTETPLTLSWSGNTGTALCDPSETIKLTATVNSGSAFNGWTGDCTGTSTTCTLTMSASKSVTANFKSTSSFALTVTKVGTGTVSASPTSLTWNGTGTTGTASYEPDTTAVLTATPDSGSIFVGWTGDCASVGSVPTCTLTMSAAKNVTATFAVKGTLTVTKTGSGTGTVSVSTGTIAWSGNTGTATYAEGTEIKLTATPDADSNFTAWSGGCTGTSTTCTVTMTGAQNVTATFVKRFSLAVTRDGSAAGKGTVSVSPGTLTWNGNTASAVYSDGDSVTLTATAPDGVTFTGWSGDCTGTVSTCTLSIGNNKSVKATFVTGYPMTVNKAGSGKGSVTVSIGNLTWIGNTGTAIYNSGVPVTLTATPETGSTFDGWLGDCSGKQSTCSVPMLAARNITAMFTSATGSGKLPNRDFNGDGNSDLMWRNAITGDVYVWLMIGTTIAGGNFVTKGVPEDWDVKATGDFDGDGKSDILWQNTTTGDVAVWLMDGAVIKTGEYVASAMSSQWVLSAIGDFDGNGIADVMWRNNDTDDIYIWLMNGAKIANGDYIARGMPAEWVVKAVADINADGKGDVIWQNTTTGDVAGWLMNGLGISTANNIAKGVSGNWQIKAVEDFNGDGKADVVWQDTSSGDIYIWLMNGLDIADGGYAARGIQRNWQLKTTGDYRGDGKTDILWQNSSTGDVYMWFMDGLNVTGGGYAATGLSNDWQIK